MLGRGAVVGSRFLVVRLQLTSVVILTQGFAAPPQPAQLQPYTDGWKWRAKAWAGCPRVVLWLPWQKGSPKWWQGTLPGEVDRGTWPMGTGCVCSSELQPPMVWDRGLGK